MMPQIARVLLAAVLLLAGPLRAGAAEPDLGQVAASIADAARAEIADKAVPSIAVALVDRGGVIWSGAWGFADAAHARPASPETVYRAGAVSELLTDLAAMELAKRGRLDLDAPVTRYLPDFAPENPFGGTITPRQLMTHRSGLVREPPRGNAFDAVPRGEADAVASLDATTLVAAPGSVTKYSDAGFAVLGEIVARVTGVPYAKAVDTLVLKPLGMRSSGFTEAGAPSRPAYAEMASFDGPRFAAPDFESGMPAAAGLYTTVDDLGRLVGLLLNRGGLPDGRLLKASSVDPMRRTGSTAIRGDGTGFGFDPETFDGHAAAARSGAIYGDASYVLTLPEDGIGVVAFSTVAAGSSARRIGAYALRALLAAQAGHRPPEWLRTETVAGTEATRLSGRFNGGGASVVTRIFDGRLLLDAPELAGEVRRAGGRYYIDDAQTFLRGIVFAPDAGWVEIGGRRFTRADTPKPPSPDPELAALIGEYGWKHNILRIYQRDGGPYARIDWVDWLPLTRLARDAYAFPRDRGPYRLETLRFERDRQGRPVAAVLSGIRFPRRDFGAEAQRKVAAAVKADAGALRAAALAASPPAEPPSAKPSDLVALTAVDPEIRLDIRYASENNFMGRPLYERADAYLQRPAAMALARVQRALAKQGYGLLIHDAYRPWFVTKMFWDATPPRFRMFVADPAEGSRHNRGAAVDLTLFDIGTGTPVVMPGRYDEFSSRSYSNYVGGSDRQRWLRELLRGAMRREGFEVYAQEWWHFDFAGWRDYPIGNRPFQELTAEANAGGR